MAAETTELNDAIKELLPNIDYNLPPPDLAMLLAGALGRHPAQEETSHFRDAYAKHKRSMFSVPTLKTLAAASFSAALAKEGGGRDCIESLRTFPSDYISKIIRSMPWEGLLNFWSTNDAIFCSHITAEVLDDAIKACEDRHRQDFSLQRKSKRLRDPHLMMLDVYDPERLPLFVRGLWGARRPSSASPFAILFEPGPQPSPRGSDGPLQSVMPSLELFREAFDVFSARLLRGLEWERFGIFAAGGSVLACLMPPNAFIDVMGLMEAEKQERWRILRAMLGPDQDWRMTVGGEIVNEMKRVGKIFDPNTIIKGLASPFSRSADVDLFVVGCKSDAAANAAVRHVYETIQSNCDEAIVAIRAQNAITFATGWPRRHVQVVLRQYMSPAEVLLGFDLDASSVGFDGTRAWPVISSVRVLAGCAAGRKPPPG